MDAGLSKILLWWKSGRWGDNVDVMSYSISNVCLKGVLSMKDMPIREFLGAGVRFK
jgi:hypothetical protein